MARVLIIGASKGIGLSLGADAVTINFK